MKNRLLAVSCAAAVLACAAALAASLATRARAGDPAPSGFTIIAQDADTKVYFLEHDGHHCYLASTRGGSGVSLQCLK